MAATVIGGFALSLFLLLLLVPIILAAGSPPVTPQRLQGTVTVGTGSAQDGLEIRVKVSSGGTLVSVPLTQTTINTQGNFTAGGSYGKQDQAGDASFFEVAGDTDSTDGIRDGALANEELFFFVVLTGDVEAQAVLTDVATGLKKASVPFESARAIELNLQVNVDLSLVVEPKVVRAGTTFTVTIKADPHELEVSAIDAFLNFDTGDMEVVSISPVTTGLDAVLTGDFDNVKGEVDYGALTTGAPPTSPFDLAVVTFLAKDAGPRAIKTSIVFNSVSPRETKAGLAGTSVLANAFPVNLFITDLVVSLLDPATGLSTVSINENTAHTYDSKSMVLRLSPNGLSVDELKVSLKFDGALISITSIVTGDPSKVSGLEVRDIVIATSTVDFLATFDPRTTTGDLATINIKTKAVGATTATSIEFVTTNTTDARAILQDAIVTVVNRPPPMPSAPTPTPTAAPTAAPTPTAVAPQPTAVPTPTHEPEPTATPAPSAGLQEVTISTAVEMTAEQAAALDSALGLALGAEVQIVAETTTTETTGTGKLRTTLTVIGLKAGAEITGAVNVQVGNITIVTEDGKGTGTIDLGGGLTVTGDVQLVAREGALDIESSNPKLNFQPVAPDATELAGGSDLVTEIDANFSVDLKTLPDGASLEVEFSKDTESFVADASTKFSAAAVAADGSIGSLKDDVAFVVKVTKSGITNNDLGDTTLNSAVSLAWYAARVAEGKSIVFSKIDDDGNVFSTPATCTVTTGSTISCTGTFTGDAGGFSYFATMSVLPMPTPTHEPEPTAVAPQPTAVPKPTAVAPQPTAAPTPTHEPEPTAVAPQPTAAPTPTHEPEPTAVAPQPTAVPKPTAAPRPTAAPKPTAAAPQPTAVPKPTAAAPKPTAAAPKPTAAPEPTPTPKPTPVIAPDEDEGRFIGLPTAAGITVLTILVVVAVAVVGAVAYSIVIGGSGPISTAGFAITGAGSTAVNAVREAVSKLLKLFTRP